MIVRCFLQTPTPDLMRHQNRAIILATIQEQGPISRVELASLLGLNPATITRITRDLIDDGLVTEQGEGETKGAGRKPILLLFNHSARLVIGIQSDGRRITSGIANLANELLTRRTTIESPTPTLPVLVELIEELLEENPSYRQRLAAICLSVPESDDVSTLVAEMTENFGIPILMSDVVTTTAVGEALVGGMRDQAVFALLYLGPRSASCVYLNGQARVGRIGLTQAGEALDVKLSDAGLVDLFANVCAEGIPSALTNMETVRAGLIFEAARHDDPAARETIRRMTSDLTYAIAWTSRALNIGHVVFGGTWVRAADLLLPQLEAQLAAWDGAAPEIHIAKLRDEASLMGAIQLAIRVAGPTI